jgi:hypothetical protein
LPDAAVADVTSHCTGTCVSRPHSAAGGWATLCMAVVAHELFYDAFKRRRAAQNVALVDSPQFLVLEFDKETPGKPARYVPFWLPEEDRSALTTC